MQIENAVSASKQAARAVRTSGGRAKGTSVAARASAARPADVVTPAQFEPLVAGMAPYVQGCVDAYRTSGLLSCRMAAAVLSVSRALRDVDTSVIRQTAESHAERPTAHAPAAEPTRAVLGGGVPARTETATAADSSPQQVAQRRRSLFRKAPKATPPPTRTDEMYDTFYGGKP